MKNKLFWLGLASIIASIFVHMYLTNHHYSFKYSDHVEESMCNMNEFMNCNTTTASNFSEFFGIPMAILGALVNFLLLLGLISYRWPIFGEKVQSNVAPTLKIASLFIFATSLVMGSISLFILKSLCPFCLASYILSIVTLFSVWTVLSSSSFRISLVEIKYFGGALLVTLALGFFFHKVSLSNFGGKQLMEVTNLYYQDWKNQSPKEFTPVEPMTLNASQTAKMKIVEFADFLCVHCKNAFPKIHTFVKSHPDVQFSFQAFPLDGACNPEIGYSDGTRCLLARLSHCSGEQNKGWEVQQWIFDQQTDLVTSEAVKEKIPSFVSSHGLNGDSLQACLDAEKTHTIISDQAKLGKEIGVKGTPALYVNGKKVQMISIPILEMIYSDLNK